MSLDARVPSGPIREKWDKHRFDLKLVNPANKRKFEVIVVGTGLAGAAAAASLGELGYHVKSFCYQDSARRAHSHRRPGRHQRGEELPERRRHDLAAVLRHGQGRRLPLARGQRLPAGAGERRHHRPVRRPGRAVRPRVRRPARQPLLRRRPGVAHLLRPRPDRPAAAAGRLPGAVAPGGGGPGRDARQDRDARSGGGRRPRPRHRHPRHGHRRDPLVVGRRGRAGHRRLLQRLLPVDQRQGLQRHRHLARPPARRLLRQPLLHPDPPDLHPAARRLPVQAHPDERVAAQRRPHLGAGEGRRRAARQRDSRERARLLPRAPLSGLRQPGAARHRLARRQGGLRRGPRRRPRRARRLPRLRRRHRPARPRRHRGQVRQPVRDVRADHRRGPVRGADAHLPGAPLHDGRSVGRLQPDVDHPGPVRHRRGQLLRSRRQPAGRQRPDAGPGRRLLRAAVHHRRLPGAAHGRGPDAHRPPGVRRASRRRSAAGSNGCWRSTASAPSTRSTASSARSARTTAACRGSRAG